MYLGENQSLSWFNHKQNFLFIYTSLGSLAILLKSQSLEDALVRLRVIWYSKKEQFLFWFYSLSDYFMIVKIEIALKKTSTEIEWII
jgi:hypothetical protein